ncbi:hypothetical protein Glove_117g260 [Diversispora epigaea]|uniref:C2H2-type domain-containing protein n=1 Tax=Diversispora epigaea TaxID=1348612 RepID=A0A397JAH1_9GLOM|nr:hypothetical protein Glove_117g260 [Diversispora epigaea]
MSTSFQCPHCPRNFSTQNAYSQHVNRCINTVYLSTEESSEDISNIVSSVNFCRSRKFSVNLCLEKRKLTSFYQYESDQDYAGDISFGEISHSSNIPEEYENFDEILPASLQSNEEPVSHSSNIPEKYENFDEILPASLQSNEEPEVENIKEFPNEAYADLMALVIENNLNNKAGNAIIKFFNKHSDLSQLSPLPKNIETGRKRNKEDAKQLLGYLPILSAKNEKEKKSSEFKELARETFHNSIKFLLDPLFQGDEACTFSLTYKLANSNYPCHFCLVQREDLIDIRKEVILRNHVNMKEYFDSNTSNLAASRKNLNIYAATVPDRMYHLDLGLFKYQIEFTMELLKKKKSLNKVNERIADIPRHSQLKVFKKGIQLSRLTVSEYRDMMKIMVFVIDNLQIEDLSEVYVK